MNIYITAGEELANKLKSKYPNIIPFNEDLSIGVVSSASFTQEFIMERCESLGVSKDIYLSKLALFLEVINKIQPFDNVELFFGEDKTCLANRKFLLELLNDKVYKVILHVINEYTCEELQVLEYNSTRYFENDPRLKEKVKNNERNFENLFSKVEKHLGYEFITDVKLKDMYDHNYFRVDSDKIDELVFEEINRYRKEKNYTHLKIITSKRNNYLLNKGLEETHLLTLVKTNDFHIKIPQISVNYLNLRDNSIADDLINLELKYYGEEYGIDFSNRKMERYCYVGPLDNRFNFYASYHEGKIIASCYTFLDNGILSLDALLVEKEYRNKCVASNLLKHLKDKYNVPLCLHADFDETSKDLYTKLGFKIINETFEYLLLDSK